MCVCVCVCITVVKKIQHKRVSIRYIYSQEIATSQKKNSQEMRDTGEKVLRESRESSGQQNTAVRESPGVAVR